MFSIDHACEYDSYIRGFFQQQFQFVKLEDGDLLELLTNAIVATGKIRLGPRPSVESLFEIRKHISAQIEKQEPILFLMPWGSEKPKSLQTVDIAEVVALKTIASLQERVSKVYAPGIRLRIRIEDATAPSLFADRKDQARLDAHIYTQSLLSLIRILGLNSFIHPVPESIMISEEEFEKEFQFIFQIMSDFLHDSDINPLDPALWSSTKAYKELNELGWTNKVPREQRDHYYSTYNKLYGMDRAAAEKTLARYFAQALARGRLNILGNLDWKDYLQLTFVGPIPGEPKGRTMRRVYYRTLPENVSSFHMPPWRSKGYLSIGDFGARPRLASWSDPSEYVSNVVTLRNESESVTVQCDYKVS